MKRIATFVALVLGLLSLEAGEQNLAVESFVLAETDLTANMEGTAVRDQNGEICALIKVETTQKGFTFDVGILGVTSVVEKTGEIWVYVPFGIRKITIMHPELGILRDYPLPCAIEKGRTYILKLIAGTVKTIVEHKVTRQFLHVKLQPSDAILELDGKEKPTENGVYQEFLSFGTYSYRVYRKNYHEASGTVQISDPNNTHHLNIVLKPAFGYVSILDRKHPEIKGASVYIDDEKVGVVPVENLMMPSGEHKLKVVKPHYEIYKESFVISDEENKVFNPVLTPDYADVTLKTSDGASIYINGEQKGKGVWSGRLNSGTYVFEARQTGYVTSAISYEVSRKDHSKTINLPAPTPIYGALVVSSVPSLARISVDGKYVGDTPKFLGNQVIGEHAVKVELAGYQTQTQIVNVVEGKETSLIFELHKTGSESQATSSASAAAAADLSSQGAANCYMVSRPGTYKIRTVKGNSQISVGQVALGSVLWETFGTDVAPNVGDLIKSVSVSNGYIIFETSDVFREGNALIAARDDSGKILWSWHIWLTDRPKEEDYKSAGRMMDRNLGALSGRLGDVGSLGLLYQWGRKDPFLGSSSKSEDTAAASTLIWPLEVQSDSNNGTVAYATAHPTTFITSNSANSDWYFTGSSSADNTRWQSKKTMYDPCPAGWRVPDGGDNGIWARAKGATASFNALFSAGGMIFSVDFGNVANLWYPAAGCIVEGNARLDAVGEQGYYWSVTPDGSSTSTMVLKGSKAWPSFSIPRAKGCSVRCVKE